MNLLLLSNTQKNDEQFQNPKSEVVSLATLIKHVKKHDTAIKQWITEPSRIKVCSGIVNTFI